MESFAYHDDDDDTSYDSLESSLEPNLLMKVQTAPEDWDEAPSELLELRRLLLRTGYPVPWTPKNFGVNLLTANKIRAMVLKRIVMKLYPFDDFWKTDTLDETLQKCLLVCQQCQQLALGSTRSRSVIWGQCSMDESYEFWKRLLKAAPRVSKSRTDDDLIQEAKSRVVSNLMSSRGTDWDKIIAANFAEALGKNTSSLFTKTHESVSSSRQKHKNKFCMNSFDEKHSNWRKSFSHILDKNQESSESASSYQSTNLTTTTFAIELKQESGQMIDALRNIEVYYKDDFVLQIEKAFDLGSKVCELGEEFEEYMSTNNRGAFRDVESLVNHTDKVVKSMSKLTMAYKDFFFEYKKYFEDGRGDEIKAVAPTPLPN